MFASDPNTTATHEDPLLDCLLEVSRLHGNTTTRSALIAGLPLTGHVLPPSLFNRAAARAGLSKECLALKNASKAACYAQDRRVELRVLGLGK